jgi:hypothetical protein
MLALQRCMRMLEGPAKLTGPEADGGAVGGMFAEAQRVWNELGESMVDRFVLSLLSVVRARFDRRTQGWSFRVPSWSRLTLSAAAVTATELSLVITGQSQHRPISTGDIGGRSD